MYETLYYLVNCSARIFQMIAEINTLEWPWSWFCACRNCRGATRVREVFAYAGEALSSYLERSDRGSKCGGACSERKKAWHRRLQPSATIRYEFLLVQPLRSSRNISIYLDRAKFSKLTLGQPKREIPITWSILSRSECGKQSPKALLGSKRWLIFPH